MSVLMLTRDAGPKPHMHRVVFFLLDFANPKAPRRITDIFLYLGHARAHDKVFSASPRKARAGPTSRRRAILMSRFFLRAINPSNSTLIIKIERKL